ncbi:hypothetical protein NEIFLAOT_01244, partial [Neisseria flavescens NRL30031/H210]
TRGPPAAPAYAHRAGSCPGRAPAAATSTTSCPAGPGPSPRAGARIFPDSSSPYPQREVPGCAAHGGEDGQNTCITGATEQDHIQGVILEQQPQCGGQGAGPARVSRAHPLLKMKNNGRNVVVVFPPGGDAPLSLSVNAAALLRTCFWVPASPRSQRW